MRFRAEIDPILLLLGVMSLYAFAVAVPSSELSSRKKIMGG